MSRLGMATSVAAHHMMTKPMFDFCADCRRAMLPWMMPRCWDCDRKGDETLKLYRIYTRQEKPGDSQYFGSYVVWAESELSAQVHFRRRLKHAVITDVFLVTEDKPILMMEA